MPGYIVHLASAKLALDRLGIDDFMTRLKVYTGSIIADSMPRVKKKESHFWNEKTVPLLKRSPDICMFENKYGKSYKEVVLAAYYGHLWMDKIFVDEYWTKHFEFYNDDMEAEEGFDAVSKVLMKDSDIILDRNIFLSDEYYYGDYTRLLPYFVGKYGLDDVIDCLSKYEKDNYNDVNKDVEKDVENSLEKNVSDLNSKVDSFLTGLNPFPVEEINLSQEECRLYMRNMIANIDKTLFELRSREYSDIIKPDLLVFDIDELEQLTYETSLVIEKMLINCENI